MAKPPRSCFVYKPLHKYRYLPRPTFRRTEYDFEAAQAGPDQFEDKLSDPPKLWVAWLYRRPVQELSPVKRIIQETFGEKPQLFDMKVFKNTPYWNHRLWKIKHLIEMKPIRFPHGEPTEEDIPHVRLLPSGECLVDKNIPADQIVPYADASQDAAKAAEFIRRKLKTKWHRYDEILEDSPWSDPNQSRF